MKGKEIIGKWELKKGKLIADSNCKTIASMLSNELVLLDGIGGGWTRLYQGKNDEIWELSYPESHLQGGGPPKLARIK